jgi:hypothetical protein
MDKRRHDPNWNKPVRTNSPANDFISGLKAQLVWMEQHKKSEEVVRIFYGGAFGPLSAARVLPEGGDFLRVEVRDEDGVAHWIVAPVSRCSFMFSVAVPTTGEPKITLSCFGDHEETL